MKIDSLIFVPDEYSKNFQLYHHIPKSYYDE